MKAFCCFGLKVIVLRWPVHKIYYITPFSHRVHITTWNVGSATPPDDITALLGLNVGDGNTDMYIIGWVFCGAVVIHLEIEVSIYVHFSHVNPTDSNEWSLSVLNHSSSSIYESSVTLPTHQLLPIIGPCLLLCVTYLPDCRKWTLWLTKGWRMSFSQTSGARSAWRDSAHLVMCWSVIAFIINTYA